MKKISIIFGTRPEAIKLCPLILALKEQNVFEPHVCVTGQHRQMLDQVLRIFGIEPDVDLKLMRPNQTLASLTAESIKAIDEYLATYKPEMVIVQGDTTTVFCSALAAFYRRIPIAHVEAGLRTWNIFSPYPEEINRVMTSRLACYHFTPTKISRDNLLEEGVRKDCIYVTGNTVIDALYYAADKVRKTPPVIPGLPKGIVNGQQHKPLVLITGHRRESFGKRFVNICNAIVNLSKDFAETEFVYPVHLNPNVREPVFNILAGHKNIHLIEPLAYLPFISLLDRCTLVLTDSGGIQEEAPSLGKPVLVMRDTTERPEAIKAGTAKLVGTDMETIVEHTRKLLIDDKAYKKMCLAHNPYGDGQACQRIVDTLIHL